MKSPTEQDLRELRYCVNVSMTRNTHGPDDMIINNYLTKASKMLDEFIEYEGRHKA